MSKFREKTNLEEFMRRVEQQSESRHKSSGASRKTWRHQGTALNQRNKIKSGKKSKDHNYGCGEGSGEAIKKLNKMRTRI